MVMTTQARNMISVQRLVNAIRESWGPQRSRRAARGRRRLSELLNVVTALKSTCPILAMGAPSIDDLARLR